MLLALPLLIVSVLILSHFPGRNGLMSFQATALKQDWSISTVLYFYPVSNTSRLDVRAQLQEIKTKGNLGAGMQET